MCATLESPIMMGIAMILYLDTLPGFVRHIVGGREKRPHSPPAHQPWQQLHAVWRHLSETYKIQNFPPSSLKTQICTLFNSAVQLSGTVNDGTSDYFPLPLGGKAVNSLQIRFKSIKVKIGDVIEPYKNALHNSTNAFDIKAKLPFLKLFRH